MRDSLGRPLSRPTAHRVRVTHSVEQWLNSPDIYQGFARYP
jgi:hypothetical protein